MQYVICNLRITRKLYNTVCGLPSMKHVPAFHLMHHIHILFELNEKEKEEKFGSTTFHFVIQL